MIRAEGLSLEIDGKRILDGVTFAVAQAESVALIGPNGSGKTSVLRCLLGLVPFAGAPPLTKRTARRCCAVSLPA